MHQFTFLWTEDKCFRRISHPTPELGLGGVNWGRNVCQQIRCDVHVSTGMRQTFCSRFSLANMSALLSSLIVEHSLLSPLLSYFFKKKTSRFRSSLSTAMINYSLLLFPPLRPILTTILVLFWYLLNLLEYNILQTWNAQLESYSLE